MGDDLPDLKAMQHCGLKLTVANAHPLLVQQADWQSSLQGGYGAVREASDLLLAAQDKLTAAVDANPDDHQARFDLAVALHANGDVEDAVAALLELFRRDREWNDGAAKAQLFKVFDALDAKDPIALNGRRKLSSLIFV